MGKYSEIFIIKSDKKELSAVEKFLYRIFDSNNLPENYFNNVLLCASEAIMNSICHGNNNNAEKTVKIAVQGDDNNIIIEIRDEGGGFDYSKIDDPTLIKNLRKESGRGLHIIKSLCKNIEFKEGGSCIRINISLSE